MLQILADCYLSRLQDAAAALDRNGQMTTKAWSALEDIPVGVHLVLRAVVDKVSVDSAVAAPATRLACERLTDGCAPCYRR